MEGEKYKGEIGILIKMRQQTRGTHKRERERERERKRERERERER